jgi:hypothetical protein
MCTRFGVLREEEEEEEKSRGTFQETQQDQRYDIHL